MAEEKNIIDILVPWILCLITFGFFWIKLKMGKHLTKLIEWINELKSKKNEDNPNIYSYVDYD